MAEENNTKKKPGLRLVEAFDKKQSLCEIYHSGFQFSFTSPDFKQCHPWVRCKDFMTDAIWATIHNKPVGIYGFKYDPKIMPIISLDPILLLVRDTSRKPDEFKKQMRQCIKFLNIVERRLGFMESRVEQVGLGDKGCVFMFTSDKKWVHAPPMFSLLGLFVRVGCFYPGGGRLNDALKYYKKEVKHNDASYLKRSRRMRLLIMKNGLQIFATKFEDNYPKNCDISTIHNQWGIVNSPGCSTFKNIWNLTGIETIGKAKEKDPEPEMDGPVIKPTQKIAVANKKSGVK